MSGSKSGPCEHVAKVRSGDLCSVVYVSVFAILVLIVCRTLSFAGAISQPYKALGILADLIIMAFLAYGAFILLRTSTSSETFFILAVKVVPTKRLAAAFM